MIPSLTTVLEYIVIINIPVDEFQIKFIQKNQYDWKCRFTRQNISAKSEASDALESQHCQT